MIIYERDFLKPGDTAVENIEVIAIREESICCVRYYRYSETRKDRGLCVEISVGDDRDIQLYFETVEYGKLMFREILRHLGARLEWKSNLELIYKKPEE